MDRPLLRRIGPHAFALGLALQSAAPAWAECPDPTLSVVVDADHFEFTGYDARQGLASVRPAAEVPGAGPGDAILRLALPDEPLLMQLLPAEFEAALEARAGGGPVELLLGVQPVPGPDAVGECGRYTPEVRGLRVAGATLGAREQAPPPAGAATPSALGGPGQPGDSPARTGGGDRPPGDGPAPPEPRDDPRVVVDEPRFDPDSAPTDGARLRRLAAHIATRCLIRAQLEGPAQGAMVIELRTSMLGQRLPPKPVVDGLVHRELSRCLVDRLFADAALWHDLPPGLQVYLPFYFRPGMGRPPAEPSPPAEPPGTVEANGAKAP